MTGRYRILYFSLGHSHIATALLSYLNSVKAFEYKMTESEQEILTSWISWLYMIKYKGQRPHKYLNRETEFLQHV